MLYQLYESQRSLMEPFTGFAQAAAKMYSNPLTPMGQSPMAQRLSAGYDLLYRLGKDYEKPAFGLHTIEVDGVDIAVQEKIAINKPFCQLLRFKRFSDDAATLARMKSQPAVLIVAPLSGHYATLLRDTVKAMLQGHKVYITDWKNARTVPMEDGQFRLDDYVNYVQEFIRHLQGLYGNCHVISVCQPTVPVLAAVSLMASRGETTPLSMTMMGGPIDARKSPTAVNNLAMQRSYEWFENNVIYRVPTNFAGSGRRVYPGFLQHTGFVAMNPDRHAQSHYDYFKQLIRGDDVNADAHRKFYDEYNAVLDMDADYYLDTIRVVFQDFALVNGTWEVMSPSGELELVKPQDITTTALFTVEGELDDISGSGQTEAAHDLCTGIDKKERHHLEAKGAGHYGIFSGRRWREVVYPAVRDFIATHALVAAQPVAEKEVAANPPAAAEKPLPEPLPKPLPIETPAQVKPTPDATEIEVKKITAPAATTAPVPKALEAPKAPDTPKAAVAPKRVVATKPAVAAKPAIASKTIKTAVTPTVTAKPPAAKRVIPPAAAKNAAPGRKTAVPAAKRARAAK